MTSLCDFLGILGTDGARCKKCDARNAGVHGAAES